MAVRAVRTRDGLGEAEARALAGALARESLHPLSRAIDEAASVQPQALGAREHPGQGVEGSVHGRVLRLGSAAFCGVDPADDGTGTQVHLSEAGRWLASFALDEALRPGAAEAVAALQRQGLRLEVLSGDQLPSVQRLARRAGIARAAGAQTPQDKLDRVAALQQAGHRVAMVGDGMNDGPVLARADLSIAMGDAVPVAQARSDFIVQGGRLDAVPAILAQARRTRRIVRQNLAWAAGYNAVCVPLAIAGLMPPWLAGLGMAASSLFVVLNAARLARLPGMVGSDAAHPTKPVPVPSP
jgi:Cu2+-exporting ATPase